MDSKTEFASLHRAGDPLILFNIWDAGSAKEVASAGAKAIATGSFSLAGAQGFADGEEMPFEQLLSSVKQIAAATTLPLSVDFEAGYADQASELSANAAALREAGAVGCNIEDRLIGQDGLRDPNEQAERIACVNAAGLFVNARTDLFLAQLKEDGNPNQAALVEDALQRAEIYAKAGAGSFFVPGLTDPKLIQDLCSRADVPVNVMRLDGMPSNTELAGLGAARISYGPGPWRDAMALLGEAARYALAS